MGSASPALLQSLNCPSPLDPTGGGKSGHASSEWRSKPTAGWARRKPLVPLDRTWTGRVEGDKDRLGWTHQHVRAACDLSSPSRRPRYPQEKRNAIDARDLEGPLIEAGRNGTWRWDTWAKPQPATHTPSQRSTAARFPVAVDALRRGSAIRSLYLLCVQLRGLPRPLHRPMPTLARRRRGPSCSKSV